MNKNNNIKKIVITTLVFAMITTAISPFCGQAKQPILKQPSGIGTNPDRNISRLVISAPLSVLEGEGFLVTVTDGDGYPVYGAIVTFWNQTYYTQNGSVFIVAPEVSDTMGAIIEARAFEYQTAETYITIIDRSDQLVIHAPTYVLEGSTFLVTVTDANNNPLDHIRVSFLNETYLTMNGSVRLTAPVVDEDLVTEIRAWQFEYFPATALITIINEELKQLVIHAPGSVMSGENFLVIVGANCNETVTNATVITGWNNRTYYTDENGYILLSAPLVEFPLLTWIFAEKEGYLSDRVYITIEIHENITLGDVNNDGYVTWRDIDPFVAAIGTNETSFQAQHPTWCWRAADCNQDGLVTYADIDPFVALIGS